MTEWDNMQEGRNIWTTQNIPEYLSPWITSLWNTACLVSGVQWQQKPCLHSVFWQEKFHFSFKKRQELARQCWMSPLNALPMSGPATFVVLYPLRLSNYFPKKNGQGLSSWSFHPWATVLNVDTDNIVMTWCWWNCFLWESTFYLKPRN